MLDCKFLGRFVFPYVVDVGLQVFREICLSIVDDGLQVFREIFHSVAIGKFLGRFSFCRC